MLCVVCGLGTASAFPLPGGWFHSTTYHLRVIKRRMVEVGEEEEKVYPKLQKIKLLDKHYNSRIWVLIICDHVLVIYNIWQKPSLQSKSVYANHNIYSAVRKYSYPSFFHVFCCCLMLNCFKLLFSTSIYTPYINDKAKHNCHNFCKFIKNIVELLIEYSYP